MKGEKMNQKLFDRIMKDSEVATTNVRKIKDRDISSFQNGEKTKYVLWEWYKSTVESLCIDIEE